MTHLKYLGVGVMMFVALGLFVGLILAAVALLFTYPLAVLPLIVLVLAYFTGRSYVRDMEKYG